MPRMRALLLLGMLAVAVCWSPARAENPRVTLTLHEVTGLEAMAALSRAAGIRVEVIDSMFDPRREAEARLQERASFNWTDVSFARALRDLCGRYHLRPLRWATGRYTLEAVARRPGAPPGRTISSERDGVRVLLRGIRIWGSREVRFDALPGHSAQGEMALTLEVEARDVDAGRIAGLANVSARDDQGRVMAPLRLGLFDRGGQAGAYPDQWSNTVHLPAPDPKAAKLAWVEGDLMVYRVYRERTVDVPLPAPAASERRRIGEVTVEVSRFAPAAGRQAAAGDPGELPAEGPLIEVRVGGPAGSPLVARETPTPLVLVGASGRLYDVTLLSSVGDGPRDGETLLRKYVGTFAPAEERLVAVRLHLVEREDPRRLTSFRLTDIPLPAEPAFILPRASARPPADADPGHPFRQREGGILVHRVRIVDRAAPEGMLSLGLSARAGEDWSGIHWMELPVGREGEAVLRDLKPGTYRLLRVYRTKDAPPELGAAGRWRNGEVVVQVRAGEKTAVPPLHWAPGAGERRLEAAPRGAPKAAPKAGAKPRPRR